MDFVTIQSHVNLESRLSKLACKRLFSQIHMARSTHEQKESLVEAILRMGGSE